MGRGGRVAPRSELASPVGGPTTSGGAPLDPTPVTAITGAGERRPPRWLRTVVLGALVLAYLIAAYRPFRLEAPWISNTIEVTDSGGLRFDGTALARTDGVPAWVAPAVAEGRVTLEVQARTEVGDQVGPARLVTVSADPRRADLTLAQQGGDLHVRLRRDGAAGVGEPAIVVDDVFADSEWRTVVLRVGDGAVTVEVDGAAVAAEAVGDDPLRSWDGTFPMALGNEVGGSRGWVGEIRQVTAQAGGISVDHLARGAYTRPSGWPSKPLTSVIVERSDVVLNVLGFLPFGVLFPLVRPGRRTVVRATVASLAMSAIMEVGQLVVVARDPSVLDLGLNTVGGAVGGVLVAVTMALGRRRSPAR